MSIGLLVVDVQPAYRADCEFIAARVAQRINNTRKPVTIVWVGSSLTDDCEESVREYLRMHGARPGRLAEALFIEKDFGFHRPWMDYGVADEDIVKVGKHMLQHGFSSSELVDLEELFQGDVPDLPRYDRLSLPHFDSRRMMCMSGFETCGGGSEACLAEMELWLQMKDKPFKRLDSLVY